MTLVPGSGGRSINTLEWTGDTLLLLNQRVLPLRESVMRITDSSGVAHAIKTMVVRGAPAIGVAAAFGLVLAVQNANRRRLPWREEFRKAAEELGSTRPTAVNLYWAIERMRKAAMRLPDEPEGAAYHLEKEAMAIRDEDVAANRRMGAHGAKLLKSGSVITHCNAGALATAGYGTALGVIRAAIAAGKKLHVFVGETRPFLQGARLTAWELVQDGIPCTLITDSMAAVIFQAGKVQAAIVGADRIAANGDVANKIGTYGLSVLCRVHRVPFYVAAPVCTIDPALRTGKAIPIEERDGREVTHFLGTRIAPDGIPAYNPAFDVTPANYVTAIVTEKGVLRPPYPAAIRKLVR
ncbi:MAG TPA: S-methyl-5-thioribose-1-phosphate isomerase [Candidatus Deferrimicrobiaceae bacterium]|nr:S-methyl-5-thioribose-1-phosphate isomerase [Candidatus Deferrimicrobiaceae bacterium]